MHYNVRVYLREELVDEVLGPRTVEARERVQRLLDPLERGPVEDGGEDVVQVGVHEVVCGRDQQVQVGEDVGRILGPGAQSLRAPAEHTSLLLPDVVL